MGRPETATKAVRRDIRQGFRNNCVLRHVVTVHAANGSKATRVTQPHLYRTGNDSVAIRDLMVPWGLSRGTAEGPDRGWRVVARCNEAPTAAG